MPQLHACNVCVYLEVYVYTNREKTQIEYVGDEMTTEYVDMMILTTAATFFLSFLLVLSLPIKEGMKEAINLYTSCMTGRRS